MKFIIAISLILGILSAIFSLPVFKIAEVTVYGNNRVTSEEILDNIGFEPYDINYIFFNKKEAKNDLKLNPYIKDVEFDFIFPSTMSITIQEREQVAYVPYASNRYLYISDEGIVLQSSDKLKDPLPIIRGVHFDEFHLGEVLVQGDDEVLDEIVYIIETMKKYNIDTKNLIIDVSDKNNIKIKYGDILINFGNADEIDEKVRKLSGILKALESRPELRGEIDISNTNIDPILKVK